jgi:hypothetical protein
METFHFERLFASGLDFANIIAFLADQPLPSPLDIPAHFGPF